MTTSLAIRTRPHQEPAGRTVIGAVPLVRVRRPPPFEPPYDDEIVSTADDWDFLLGFGHGSSPDPDRAPDEPPAAGAHRAPAEPAAPTEPDELSVLPAGRPAAPGDGTPPRTVTGRHAAHRYVGLCLEVLEGFRPVGHLRRFTVPAAFESVAHQLGRPVARAGHPPSGEVAGRLDPAAQSRRPAGGTGRPGPTAANGPRAVPQGRAGTVGGTGPAAPAGTGRPRTGIAGSTRRTGTPGGMSRPQTGIAGGARPGVGQPQVTGRATLPGPSAGRISLRRMRVAEPRDGAVEAVAVLSRAERTWALALRLECREGTWLCTHVEVV